MEVTLLLNGRLYNLEESHNEVPELITILTGEESDEVIDNFSDGQANAKSVSTNKSILF